MWQSMSTKSYLPWWNLRTASRPVGAKSTSQLSVRKTRSISVRLNSLSSASSTRWTWFFWPDARADRRQRTRGR